MRIEQVMKMMVTGVLLSGCVPVIMAGGSEVAYTAAQERTAGQRVDDLTIYSHLKQLYLQKDVDTLFVGVGIEVVEGRVLLTGNVATPEHMIEAVRLAWIPQGVKEVINEIQVRDKSSVRDMALDSWITAQIKSRLLLEKHVRSVNYSVETINQVVYLIGIAQDEAELKKAVYLASTTKYVTQVVSHVRLKNDPRRPI